jgi:Ni,Fe-hydrogenase maturation factor
MTLPPPSLRLLVCGSADRGDDGAAVIAVARLLPSLEDRLRQRLEVRRCEHVGAADVIQIPAGEACLIVDTVTGIEPGTVVRMTLRELATGTGGIVSRSSQPGPIDEVLRSVRRVLGRLPNGAYVAIGGHWFGSGGLRSRAVTFGLPQLEAAIRDAIVDVVGAHVA